MTVRVGYVLSALLLGVGALVGVQYSSATFSSDSSTPAQVTAARDWTPPAVFVNAPGFAVLDVVSVVATASDDNTSVASVEIQYRRVGTTPWVSLCVDDDGSPWDCSWDTETVVDAVYELRAIAVDVDGNTETSATVNTQVANTLSVVLDPVPSPVRGTITLTARMVNPGSGSSSIAFRVAPTGTTAWTTLCTRSGPEASCDFLTTGHPDGAYDLQVVGTWGPRTYTDVQTGVVVDNTAPTVTVDQAAGQADPTHASSIGFTVVFSEPVTGFASADVILGGSSGGTKSANVTGSGASYTVTVSGMSGDGTVTAAVASGAAADGAGNPSHASTSIDNTVTHDSTPPAAPSVPQLQPGSDSGTLSTDRITKVVTPTFTGTAEQDAVVTLYSGGVAVGSGAAAGGSWTITTSVLTEGDRTVTATATDPAGNTGAASAGVVVTIDTTPPAVPGLPDLASTSDSFHSSATGTTNTDNVTSATTPTFTGSAAAGSSVALYSGETLVGTGPATGGSFSITTSALNQGVQTITARATDVAGNTSSASAGLTVTIDSVAPIVSITNVTYSNSNGQVTTTGTAGRLTGDNGSVGVVICKTNSWPCTVGNTVYAGSEPVNQTSGLYTDVSDDVRSCLLVCFGPGRIYVRVTQYDHAGNEGLSTVVERNF